LTERKIMLEGTTAGKEQKFFKSNGGCLRQKQNAWRAWGLLKSKDALRAHTIVGRSKVLKGQRWQPMSKNVWRYIDCWEAKELWGVWYNY